MKTKFNKTEKQKLSKTFSIVAIASILIGSLAAANMQSAYAVTVIDTYDDKTAFTTDTGATTIGAIPDSGLIGAHLASDTIGDATFSTVHLLQELYFGDGALNIPNLDWTTLTTGNDIALSDNEDLDISLANPVYSLGFEFVEPSCTQQDGGNLCGNGDVGSNVLTENTINSEFEVTLTDGGTPIAMFTFNAPDDTAAFVGVWSNDPFDGVEIRETTGTNDNEYYGEFFTGDTPRVVVNVAKFYDSNLDGIHDDGEVFLDDWLVHVNDTNHEFEFTNATYVLLSSETFTATEFIPNDYWIPTNDTVVTFNSSNVDEILFSNVCVGESGENPHTKGFWSNKNGQELCKQYEEDENAILGNLTQFPHLVDSENMVKDIDACIEVVHDKATKTKNYLKNPTHGNINYTLSQQLLTMVLNNATESVNPADNVYCHSIGQFFNLTSLMIEANATLAGVGSFDAGGLAECLDDANNDMNYVQEEACEYDFGTDVTVEKILTQNGILNTTFIDGESYNYTITVNNTGSYPAVNANLYDIMGSNYQDLGPNPVDACWTDDSGVYSCDLGDLVGSVILNIELSLFGLMGEYTNHAVVNGTNFDEVDVWYNATAIEN